MNEDAGRGVLGRLRLSPRSLRWRLQLWQVFLLVSMTVGFGLTVYQLQRVNRLRQVDSELETRVTALSRAVRDVYRDGPPGRGPAPDDGHSRSAADIRTEHEERTSDSAEKAHDNHEPGPEGYRPGNGRGLGARFDPGSQAHGPRQGLNGRGEDFNCRPEPVPRLGPDAPQGAKTGTPHGPGPRHDFMTPPDSPHPDSGGKPRAEGLGFPAPPMLDREPIPPPERLRDRPGNRQFASSDHHEPPQRVADANSPQSQAPLDVPLSAETVQLFGPAGGGYYFVIWYRDGTVLKRSAIAPSDSSRPAPGERDTLPHFRTRGDYREVVHCSGFGECVMAGRSIRVDLAALSSFGWKVLGAGVGISVLGLALGWLVIGRAIRPVEEMATTAMRIARGDLSERINVGHLDDELGRLADLLNVTFARLEAAFVRQQEFTSNAAHELRTPISILISEAQTILARDRSAEEYRETVEGGLETAQQMRKITETLLELARFDAGAPSVSHEVIDLAQLASSCVERFESVAAKNGTPIRNELAPALALVSAERVEVVIANLLTNALYYNGLGGEVRVETYSENGTAVVKVSDTGLGIAPADIPHIFERFYRADTARSRSHGHAGLGLAICRSIVEAEHGEISVLSKLQEGTTFMVRFKAR